MAKGKDKSDAPDDRPRPDQPDKPQPDPPELRDLDPDTVWQGIVSHDPGLTTVATFETRREADEWCDAYVTEVSNGSAIVLELTPSAPTVEPTDESSDVEL